MVIVVVPGADFSVGGAGEDELPGDSDGRDVRTVGCEAGDEAVVVVVVFLVVGFGGG